MPQQFVVPQFIDVEDKIIGPITVRQFVIILATALTDVIVYKIFSFAAFVVIGIPILGIGIVFAFVRVNGQPFHMFFLNMLETIKRPKIRVWYKDLNDVELRKLMAAPPAPPAKQEPIKEQVSSSRLQELALIANTGGVYRPEEWK